MLRGVILSCSFRRLNAPSRCRRPLPIGLRSLEAPTTTQNLWELSRPQWYSNASYFYRNLSASARNEIDRRGRMLFSSTSENQATAIQLIERIHDGRVPPGLVAPKVEEMLLKLVTNEANVGRKHEEGPLALDLLNVALSYNKEKTELIPRLCSLSMQVMRRSGHPLASIEIHRIMWMLLENRSEWFTKDLILNTRHVNDAFCQVIRSLVDADDIGNHKKTRLDYDTRRRLDQLMNFMQRLWDNPSVRLVANSESIHAVIFYLCKQHKASEAYQLLRWTADEMVRAKHPVPLAPHVSSFTTIISTFGKLGDPEAAEGIIHWMLANCQKRETRITDKTFPRPNRSCMNALLDGWARSGREDAGIKAETTLEWMEQLHNGPDALDTKPDEISYSICANAWAHSKPGRDSAMRAEDILRRMIDLHERGTGGIGPTTEPAFIAVMNAWARSKADDAPHKVTELLKLTQELSDANNQSFSMPEIRYTVLIKAWQNYATQQRPGSDAKRSCGDKILQVISSMEKAGVHPTAPTHNATIMALLEISPINALLYFLEVEDKFRHGQAHVDTRTFNCGLNVLATLNKPDGAEQAMAILERMMGYSHQADKAVQADLYTYNISLKVLSRSSSTNAAMKANQLLEEMERMPNVKPSYISYMTCIIAWGRSEDPNKFDRVRDLLVNFEKNYDKGELSGRLTVIPYNAALAVCHHNTSLDLQSQALQTATETMAKVRQLRAVRPDETTYSNLFRAMMVNCSPDDDKRDDILEPELEKCIGDGLVSAEIVKGVYQTSRKIFHKYFGDRQTPESVILPKAWGNKVHLRRNEPDHASGAVI